MNIDLKKYKKDESWKGKLDLVFIEEYSQRLGMIPTNIVITETKTTFTLFSKIGYEKLVAELVRQKYTQDEEFAILRKAINGLTDEYKTYNAYVESCKGVAKAFIELRGDINA